MFQAKEIGTTVGQVGNFRKRLLLALGNEILDFTKLELIFNALQLISPVNKSVQLNEESIEQACTAVAEIRKQNRSSGEIRMKVVSSKASKKPPKTQTNLFYEIILGLYQVPSEIYGQLVKQIDGDLLSISDLIKWYEEEQPFIQRHLRKGDPPRNHFEKFAFEFYMRCKLEREEILKYKLYDLRDRIINKASSPAWMMSVISHYQARFYDRPYRYARQHTGSYFDMRSIDLVGHRLMEFPMDETHALERLYATNKIKFYGQYFKKTSKLEHFERLTFYLAYVPLAKDRKVIFKELEKLFSARRWIAFYALALPQVEGLFAEMVSSVEPDKDLSQSSLPSKVSAVRPYHSHSDSYFDYFEYHIPQQRNKFAHTGFDDDFKLKSFDLLVDLVHLTRIFYELEHPSVQLQRLFVRRNPEDFIDLSDLNSYFALVNNLKPTQKKKMSIDIVAFEATFLSKDCNLEFMIYEVCREVPLQIQKLEKWLEEWMGATSDGLFSRNKYDIKEFTSNESNYYRLKDCFLIEQDAVTFMSAVDVLLRNYKDLLPSLPPPLITELHSKNMEYGKKIRLVVETNTIIEEMKAPDEL